MLRNKLSVYFHWIWNKYQYHIINHLPEFPFKVIGKELENGIEKLIIQIENTQETFTQSPHDLVEDESLLYGFSQGDVRLITYLATVDSLLPEYQIIAQSKVGNTEILTIKQKGKKGFLTRTASEISFDETLLSAFSAKDAHLIGYITGTQKEKL